MNLRTLMVALGAIGLFAISPACEIKEGTGGSGGEGGAGQGGAGGGGGEGGTAGAGGGAGGAGGMMAACYDKGCGVYITDDAEMAKPWCDEDPNFTPGSTNPSYDLYVALSLCTCGDPNNPAVGGTCKTQCADEACAGKTTVVGGECQKCIVDTAAGCGNDFNACGNDI